MSLPAIFSVYLNIPVGLFFRPLSFLVFLLAWKTFGFHILYYHLMNVVLHCCNSILVFQVGKYFFKSEQLVSPAFLAAVIFALHPRNIEAVATICSYTDLLCVLFLLIALLFFLRHQRETTSPYLLVSSVFFLFSLFSKESAIVFPLIAVLSLAVLRSVNGQWRSTRTPVRYQIGIFLLALSLYFLIRFVSIGTIGIGFTKYANYSAVHIMKFVVKGLVADLLPSTIFSLLSEDLSQPRLEIMISIIVVLTGLVFVIVRSWPRRRQQWCVSLFLLLCAAICLLPVSPFSFSLISSQENRFLYLPTLFFSLFTTGVLSALFPSRKLFSVSAVVSTALFFYLVRVEYTPWTSAFRVSYSLFGELKNLNGDMIWNSPALVVLDAPIRFKGAPVGMSREEVMLALEIQEGNHETQQARSAETRVDLSIEVLTFTDVHSESPLFPVRWTLRRDTLVGESAEGEKVFVGMTEREDNHFFLQKARSFSVEAVSYDTVSYSCEQVKIYPFSSFPFGTVFISCGLGKIQRHEFRAE